MTLRVRRSLAVTGIVIGGGVLIGTMAALGVLFVHGVTWLAFGTTGEPSVTAAHVGTGIDGWMRRLLPPVLGGIVVGCSWWWLRKDQPAPSVSGMIQDASREDTAPTPPPRRLWWRSLLDAFTQLTASATGASIGREAAPRLMAAGAIHDLTAWAGLPPRWRRVLIASASGAGLAAVYNVPVTGVIFAITVMLTQRWEPVDAAGAKPLSEWRELGKVDWSWPAVLVAVPMSVLATVVAWTVVGSGPRLVIPQVTITGINIGFAVIAGIVGGVVGFGFATLSHLGRSHAPRPGIALPVQIGAMGVLAGFAALYLPVGGNGLAFLEPVLLGRVALPALLAYAIVKPLLTSGYLRAGVVGGLLLPALSVGAALGGATAIITEQPDVATFALIGAASVLAASQRAWIFAASLCWELTHVPVEIGLCLVLAALGGHAIALNLERLRAQRGLRHQTQPPPVSPPPSTSADQ